MDLSAWHDGGLLKRLLIPHPPGMTDSSTGNDSINGSLRFFSITSWNTKQTWVFSMIFRPMPENIILSLLECSTYFFLLLLLLLLLYVVSDTSKALTREILPQRNVRLLSMVKLLRMFWLIWNCFGRALPFFLIDLSYPGRIMKTFRASFIFSLFCEIWWSYVDTIIQPLVWNNKKTVSECNISISKCNSVVSKSKDGFALAVVLALTWMKYLCVSFQNGKIII